MTRKFVWVVLAMTLVLPVLAAEPVTVDFTKPTGSVKPLDGIVNSPMPFVVWKPYLRELTEIKELGTPFVRLHDTGGAYGRNTFVDIPNVFRDFDADEDDPANYDFAFTDAYLKALVEAGATPYYRIGVTIENYWHTKAYRIYPPKDFSKYARICEHVVRHYTKGWANGFKWDMPYWEFWCEPENKMLWLGTRQQFYELYAAVAKEVKAHHPDIKFGGYGACRWETFENLDVNSDSCRENWLGWFEDFCDYVNAEKAPFDFFSWHLYSPKPNDYLRHSSEVQGLLEKHRLGNVEQHVTEYNFGGKYGHETSKGPTGAVYTVSCLCNFQKTPVKLATLYAASPSCIGWCTVFDPYGKPTSVYYALQKFAELRKLGTCYETQTDVERFIYAIAASDGKDKAFMIANDSFTEDRRVKIDLRGADMRDFDEYRLDLKHLKFEKVGPAGGLTEIELPWKGAVYYTTKRK